MTQSSESPVYTDPFRQLFDKLEQLATRLESIENTQSQKTATSPLVLKNASEIAGHLGLAVSTVYQIRQTDPDFPASINNKRLVASSADLDRWMLKNCPRPDPNPSGTVQQFTRTRSRTPKTESSLK